MKLNKKGFTLVELLAVVVILVIIVSIAIPTITSTLERQKEKRVTNEQELLASAAELYLSSNAASTNYKTGSTCSVRIQDLIDNDYISKNNISNAIGESDIENKCLSNQDGVFKVVECTEAETKCEGGTLSKNALLSNITIEGATLSPKFNANTTEYTLSESLSIGTTSVKVTAAKSDSNSVVNITGNTDLQPGDNTITIKVTAEDKTTTKTYTVKVNVEKEKSTDTSLASLTVNEQDVLTTKTITLEATNSIEIKATPTDSNATIVSGTGTKNVTPGSTQEFEIVVQSEAGNVETHTISVTIIKEAWYGCFRFDNESQIITKYDNTCSMTVSIPDTINNKEVLGIGSGSFSSIGIESITIPNTVTYIGASAFYGNQLLEVYIPNSVKKIEDDAFTANNLKKVEFESNSKLISIGSYSFANNQLTSINIPNSVTEIKDMAFNLNNISNVYYNDILSNSDGFIYDVHDNGGVNDTILISYGKTGGEVTIPENVKTIWSEAFKYSGITSLAFESLNNLTSIDYAAFEDCNLSGVSLPESLITISNRAFYKSEYSNSNFTYIYNNSRKSFNWGQIINDSSGFEFSSGIVENSFGNVEVGSPEKFIYEIVDEDKKTVQINGFADGYSEKNLVLPETINIEGIDYKVVSIGPWAFESEEIESLEIPNNLFEIKSGAFRNNKLTSLDLKNVLAIGAGAFNDNQLSQEQAYINNPSADSVLVSYGGKERNAENIIIPSNITYIDTDAFAFCEIQGILTIPEGITYIADHAFFENGITDLKLPSTIETIGDSAFANNNISTLIIPKTDNHLSIGLNAFVFNDITYIYNENGEKFQWGKILNADPNSNYFSEGIVGDIYITNPNNYEYTDEENSIITYNNNGSTYACGHEGTVYGLVLPPVLNNKRILGIANDAFRIKDKEEEGRNQISGTALTICTSDVIIPDTVTSIGSNAFSGNGLTSISLPSSIEYIGSGAFSENNLTEVTLPDGITDGPEDCTDDSYDIGDSVFINNYKLWKINCNTDLDLTHVLHATYGDCTGCRNGSVNGYLTWWGKDSSGNGGTCIFKNWSSVCNYN